MTRMYDEAANGGTLGGKVRLQTIGTNSGFTGTGLGLRRDIRKYGGYQVAP